MKTPVLLILGLCFTAFSALAQDKTLAQQAKVDQIKVMQSDNDYWALLKAKAELNTLLTYNEVNMKEISKLDFSPYETFCEMEKSLFENIEGGAEYLRLNCDVEINHKHLFNKYESLIKTLSKEEKIELFYTPASLEIDMDLLIERWRGKED